MGTVNLNTHISENVARALMRAASRLVSTLACEFMRFPKESVETSLDAARMSARATLESDTLSYFRR